MGPAKCTHIVVFLALVILQCVLPISAEHVFDVYRLFQLDKSNAQLGSQRSGINLPAVTVSRKGSLSKHVVVLPLKDFNRQTANDLLFERNAGGLLVLLPRNDFADDVMREWRAYERELAQTSVPVSIYFAFEDDRLNALVEDLDAAEGAAVNLLSEHHQLVAPTGSSTGVKVIPAMNFQGFLAGLPSFGVASPTIALVASYDTFAVAPKLAYGADSSASAVVAVLEAARVFSRLYEQSGTQSPYNLLFALTGGSVANFAGATHYLDDSKGGLLRSAEFVLCLESIGSAGKLHLHTAPGPKAPDNIVNVFRQTAAQLGIEFDVVLKPVAEPYDWQHEAFTNAKLPAATLTNLPTAPPAFGRSSLFDTRERVSAEAVRRNVQFVVEALAKYVYNLTSPDYLIIDGSYAVSQPFVDAWLDVVSETPRYQPLVSPDSPLMKGFASVFDRYTRQAQGWTFTLDDGDVFYNDPESTTMSLFKTKSAVFDVLLTALTTAYLVVLFVAMQGPTEAVAQVKKLFATRSKVKSQPKKKTN